MYKMSTMNLTRLIVSYSQLLKDRARFLLHNVYIDYYSYNVCIFILVINTLVALLCCRQTKKNLCSVNNLPYSTVFCTLMAQDNFFISQKTNFNNYQLLCNNMFSININKNIAIRKSKNSNSKP